MKDCVISVPLNYIQRNTMIVMHAGRCAMINKGNIYINHYIILQCFFPFMKCVYFIALIHYVHYDISITYNIFHYIYLIIIYYIHTYYLNAAGIICFNLFALKYTCMTSKCDSCLLHGSIVGSS